MTRYDTIRHDTTRYDTIRHDTTRYDTIRIDTIIIIIIKVYFRPITEDSGSPYSH